jgi:hypothetical protein
MFKLLRFRILLAIGGILFAMSAAYHAMHTTEGVMSVAKHEGRLSADAFRAPIARLEGQLFAAAPLSMEQRVRVAGAFDDLKQALSDGSDTHMAHYSARELGTLAAMSRGLGPLSGVELDRVRQNWMRVRSNTFDDAAWFRFSEADPVASASEPRVTLSDADQGALARLQPMLDEIASQADRGESDAERMGEPHPDGSFDPGLADEWKSWAGTWGEQIQNLRNALPTKPDASSAMRVRFAWESADRALDELAKIPGSVAFGARPPYKIEWTRHVQNARRELQSARNWLTQAAQGRAS